MAEPEKKRLVEDKEPVKINVSQYRSMILTKLRADIAAKQMAYDYAQIASPAELQGMDYWKMGYWKMAYWKMGALDTGGDVINPAPEEG